MTRISPCRCDTFLYASNDDDNEKSYQEALARAQEKEYERFVQHEAPKWMTGTTTNANQEAPSDSLPFACTECGKCCQTIGDVYLTASETKQAAQVLDLDTETFVQQYASHVIHDAAHQTWIRLQDKGNSCIFLDETTKHCQIYQARPVQCRTYPFWPLIVQSREAWNAECRRADNDDNDNESDATRSNLPLWTPEEGGCEGMQVISKNGNTKRLQNHNDDEEIPGVPMEQALRQLYEYSASAKHFPHDAIEKAL